MWIAEKDLGYQRRNVGLQRRTWDTREVCEIPEEDVTGIAWKYVLCRIPEKD